MNNCQEIAQKYDFSQEIDVIICYYNFYSSDKTGKVSTPPSHTWKTILTALRGIP